MKSARFALHSAAAATVSALGGSAVPYGHFTGPIVYGNTYGDGSGYGGFDRHPSVAEEAVRAAHRKAALRAKRPRLRAS